MRCWWRKKRTKEPRAEPLAERKMGRGLEEAGDREAVSAATTRSRDREDLTAGRGTPVRMRSTVDSTLRVLDRSQRMFSRGTSGKAAETVWTCKRCGPESAINMRCGEVIDVIYHALVDAAEHALAHDRWACRGRGRWGGCARAVSSKELPLQRARVSKTDRRMPCRRGRLRRLRRPL